MLCEVHQKPMLVDLLNMRRLQPEDYIPYLCGLNYTDKEVGVILQSRVRCAAESSIREGDLNYPSFAVTFSSFESSSSQTYTRTVTNVGEASSSYVVETAAPAGIEVRVEPAKLDFYGVKQKLEYNVTFVRLNSTVLGHVQGYLKWVSSKHSVRSPIAGILR
ncbi:hypothetical protein SASPL_123726 [Salvia splendens]|uniref:Subtilisin-like protease fibronectin type-III domain-containing protein n=1 Tax=Salvia splendens TaxID=180675 RepID=A0A8X8XNQ5_SALSN|nr:hypothetical protein SASPL_123726 [Salvia splendens]